MKMHTNVAYEKKAAFPEQGQIMIAAVVRKCDDAVMLGWDGCDH